MNKLSCLLLALVFYNITYAQQDVKPDTAQGRTPDSSYNSKSPAWHYQGIIETGYSWGLGEWGQSVVRFNVINSIRLPYYSIGIGSGFSIPNRNQSQYEGIRFEYQVPIYLDNRVYFPNKRIQPYLSVGVGMSFVAHDMLADISLFLNSSTGLLWEISDQYSLIIGIAYESYNIMYDHIPERFTKHSSSLGFSIGISF